MSSSRFSAFEKNSDPASRDRDADARRGRYREARRFAVEKMERPSPYLKCTAASERLGPPGFGSPVPVVPDGIAYFGLISWHPDSQ